MTTWKKVALKVVIALSLTTTSIYIFAPWEYALYYLKPLPNSIQAELDQATQNGLDGVIVYVQQGSKPGQTYTSGWHNRVKRIPAYEDALFKIASIAKLYDAVSVTKLVAENKLSLDKTLADYLPELKERIANSDKITLRMMVQHRSGIPNYTDQKGFDWSSNSIEPMSLVLDKPADFEPDTDYAYSNTNYLLLQNIMSRVLGYHYTQYTREKVLDPLALKHTFFSINDVDIQALMSGYYVGSEQDFKMLDQSYIATAKDVGIFLRALNDGTLLNEDENKIYASLYEYEHTGWVLGYSSIARYHADKDTVLIQFTNTTGDDRVLLTQIVYARILSFL